MEVDQIRPAWTIAQGVFRSKMKRPYMQAGSILTNALDVVVPTLAIAALTHTFGSLDGWTFPEVALLLGASNFALGMALLTMGAFDSFLFVPAYRSGQFEAALLHPMSTVWFLAASNVRPYRVGRVIAAIAILVMACVWIDPLPWQLLAVLPMTLIIASIMLACMWFVDAAGLILLGQPNDMTRNIPFVASEVAFFPQGLYPGAMRFVAQFVLGVGAAIYLPLAYVLGKEPNLGIWSLVAGPAVLPVIALVCRLIWLKAIARFEEEGI